MWFLCTAIAPPDWRWMLSVAFASHVVEMSLVDAEVCHRRNPSQMYGMPKKMDE